jgi:transcriptional regulator with XRE-family HTH domain
MNISMIIKERLDELDLDQKDLAAAAKVTESYISQLLTGKKAPPAPDRTDIYEKMARFLGLPIDRLSSLADLQRKEQLKKTLQEAPAPLFKDVRALILRKCSPDKRNAIRGIFENHPFGELERLVTQKLLDVVKNLAKEELDNENWLRLVARLGRRSYEEMRVIVLEFLDADVFNLSPENCVSFLDPLIDSWQIDLTSFSMEIMLNRRVALGQPKRFEFVERESDADVAEESGLREFLRNRALRGDASQEEIEFLRKLRFKAKRPTPLYYYRELQNLRDPLHFRSPRRPAGGRVARERRASADL